MSRQNRSIKQFDLASTMKGVSAVRKALIEAQRQAMLASDDLDDAKFNSAPTVNSAGETDQLEEALQAVMGIAECVSKAIEFSDSAKTALRGKMGDNAADIAESAGEQAVDVDPAANEIQPDEQEEIIEESPASTTASTQGSAQFRSFTRRGQLKARREIARNKRLLTSGY